MKKLSKQFMVMLIVFMFSTTMVVSAKEGPTVKDNQPVKEKSGVKVSPEEKFNGFITDLEQKQSARFDEASANRAQADAERKARNAKFLETVALYAPELTASYTTAFAAHDALHVSLFTTHTEIKNTFATQTLAELSALKIDLFAQVTAGTLTYKEAKDAMKAYLESRKVLFTASKDAYQAAIAPAVAEMEGNAAEVKALHDALKVAIAANDTASANTIIGQLYTYLQAHIAFDGLKLDTLNAMF